MESPAMSTFVVPAGSGAWLAGGAEALGATVVSWPGRTIVFCGARIVVAGAAEVADGVVVAAPATVVVGATTATTLEPLLVATEGAVQPVAGLGEADRRGEVVERAGDTGGDRARARAGGQPLGHVEQRRRVEQRRQHERHGTDHDHTARGHRAGPRRLGRRGRRLPGGRTVELLRGHQNLAGTVVVRRPWPSASMTSRPAASPTPWTTGGRRENAASIGQRHVAGQELHGHGADDHQQRQRGDEWGRTPGREPGQHVAGRREAAGRARRGSRGPRR